MRTNLRPFFIILGLLISALPTFAADYYWVGTNSSPANWSNAANWSATSGGTGGASIPGASDVAIFDENSGSDCSIAANINVGEIRVLSGYMDWNTFEPFNIYQNAVVAATKVNLSDGTFVGGTANMLIRESLNITGGVFKSTSGVVTFQGTTFNYSSGGFVHNNGTILFTSVAGGTVAVNISGTPQFYNVRLSGGGDRDIVVNNTIKVNNNLTIEGSNSLNINTGTIILYGNLVCSNTGLLGGGTALISFDGTNQAITGNATQYVCRLPKVTFNTSGTLTFANNITFTNNFTNNANSLDAGTSSVVFANGNTTTYTISGSGASRFNNLEFNPSVSITCNIDPLANVSVANNFTYAGTGAVSFLGGSLSLEGNTTISNTNTTGTGGTTNFIFNGLSDQTITRSLSGNAGLLPAVTINKATGNLILPSALVVTGNWTYTSGTIDYTTNNSTVTFSNNNLSISGTHRLRNVAFKSSTSGTAFTIAAGTNLLVTGNLTLENGGTLSLNTGTISVAGNVVNNNNSVNGGGTATLLLNGTANQTLNGRSVNGWGRLPNVVINKASGILTLNSRISLGTGSSWTYLGGTVNAGTSTLYVNDGGTVFTGSHTLNNLTFDPSTSGSHTYTVSTGTTLSLTGDLYVSGQPGIDINLNNGEIKLITKDVYMLNTGLATGGTTTITMAGTGTQSIIGHGTTGLGAMPKLNINKASGTLLITNKVTIANELMMTQGNVNLDNDILTLGTGATNRGTLTYTGGTLYGGTFSRWYGTSAANDLTNESLFPMGSTTDYRPVYISTTSNPTIGGTMSVFHDPTTGTASAEFNEGSDNITKYSNAYWTLESANGLTGGTYNVRINAANVIPGEDMNDLRIVVPGTATGTHGSVSGTNANPSITRTSLTLADLNNSFNIGSKYQAPLPVELISFEAKKETNNVDLTWQTAMEKNNDFFTVERSVDGIEFMAIGNVKGAGTTTVAQKYTLTDSKPVNGISYYRLKQTDFDGNSEYSKIVQIEFADKEAGVSLNAYPNPTTDLVNLQITGLQETATLHVIDITGRLISEQQITKGAKQVEVNLGGNPAGMYQLKIVSPKGTSYLKVIKK